MASILELRQLLSGRSRSENSFEETEPNEKRPQTVGLTYQTIWYQRVCTAEEHRISYSLRKLLSFEDTAGARVVPINSCSSEELQNVGKSSSGSDLI